MGRIEKWLTGPHRSVELDAAEGRRYRIVARRKGFPETERIEPALFFPPDVNLIWLLYRDLRWNIAERRRWVAEVLIQDNPHSPGRRDHAVEVRSRRRAYEVLDAEADRLRRYL